MERGTDGEPFTTDQFLALCYKCKLTRDDIEDMTIGMCIDYIFEWVEMNKPKDSSESAVRTATQADFDRF